MTTRAQAPSRPAAASAPIALLHWGDLIEDFLDAIGVSFETFRDEMTGGWLFGYIEALGAVGVETVVVCVTARVERPERTVHAPTGATMLFLPASRPYRWLRSRLPQRYAWSAREAVRGTRGGARILAHFARELAPYLSTPLLRLRRGLRETGCRAILCQEYEFARFDVCLFLGAFLRLPVFASFQGGNASQTLAERALRPVTVPAAAGLIVGSAREAGRVRGRYRVPPERVVRIFNPLDVEPWAALPRAQARQRLGIDEALTVVAWHGRVELRRKGLDVLVEAWRRLQRGPGADQRLLMLVGTGPDRDELARSLAGVPGVRWLDEYVVDRTFLLAVLSAADVYAFPSRHEGFPVAPIEAMAVGLPVVAADAPGVHDIFDGGEASGGVVVPSGEADAFTSALGTVLADASRRRQLGERARQRAQAAFSVPAVGAQLRALLEGAACGLASAHR